MNRALVLIVSLSVFGCVDTLQDAARPPGEMRADGRINPCHGWERDKELCGESKFFAKAVNEVSAGQTKEEVRAIMKRDPWRRQIRDGAEEWGYSTSYEQERMVWIVFRDGKVVELREAAWDPE